MFDYDDHQDTISELRYQVRHDQRYHSMLAASPSCDDPDHPGCSICCEDDCDD